MPLDLARGRAVSEDADVKSFGGRNRTEARKPEARRDYVPLGVGNQEVENTRYLLV